MEKYQAYKIQIKMFGFMQVETQAGVVKEPTRESEAWKFLKYLLVKRGVSVSQEEVQETLWQGSEDLSYSNFRVRLSRLRSALKDVGLGGKKGLILSDNGLFDLNPEYDIQTDAGYFDILIERIRNTSEDDAEGLTLCTQALTLYRGEYMGRTEGAWLDELRAHYRQSFEYLIRTTMERTASLRDSAALSILSSRTAAIMPEDDELRREIIRIAGEIKDPRGLSRRTDAEENSRREENCVRVRMFGLLELENQFGLVGEPAEQPSQAWLMLKYLLVNRGREVSQEEFMEQVWAGSRIDTQKNGDGAQRVYLSRLRQGLKPLHLDGKKGLVSFTTGYYGLNPDFELNTDADFFWVLVNQIRNAPFEDPQGLILCVEALEVFRGKLLENTQGYPWLVQQREQYNEELCFLICSTLERMETLQDHSAIALVSRRALDIVPEEVELHHEIIRFMMGQNLQEELVQHMTQWLDSGYADAGWPAESREEETSETVLFSFCEENAVAVSLFGAVELRNQFGRVVEAPEQTPEIWMLLKYLLLCRDRDVSEEELARVLLSDAAQQNVTNTFMLRRRRVRELLEPLKQDGTDGLILYENGKYRVNPDYPIYTDEDLFQSLMKSIREVPEDDPEGLNACIKALELYRGAFMQYTKSAAWLSLQRKDSYDEFCYLAHSTFRRMRALGDSSAIGLLARRVAAVMPRAKELHAELISYMMEQNRQEELEGFIAAMVC